MADFFFVAGFCPVDIPIDQAAVRIGNIAGQMIAARHALPVGGDIAEPASHRFIGACNIQRGVMADEIPVIEAYLGQPLPIAAAPALSMTGTALPVQRPGTPRGVSDVSRQAQLADAPAAGTAALPVVPVYAFGDTQRDRPLDYVVRHPLQAGMAEAFAYYMPDDTLAPRYFTGEIIYVHPTRPPVAARDCIIIHVDGTAKLARLMAQTAHKIRVQCFAPQKEKDIPRKNISALYSVVGRG